MALKHATVATDPQSPLLGASEWNAAHVVDAGGITFNDGTTQTTAFDGSLTKNITQTAHGFIAEDVLYHNGTIYAKAKADSATTSDVVGIVSAVIDANNFTLTTSGGIDLTGATPGQYFLSDTTAGLATLTPPATSGHIRKPVMVATSSTSGIVQIMLGVEIAPSAGGSTWGSITGTLSDQTDLQTALNAKQGTISLTTTGTSGAATFSANTLNIPQYATANQKIGSVGGIFNGGGAALSTGTSVTVVSAYSGTITGYVLTSDVGTCTVKTWKKAAGTAIPTVADNISTSGVSLSTGTMIRSSTVTDFITTSVTAGDAFRFDLSAVGGGATWVTFQLEITKS